MSDLPPLQQRLSLHREHARRMLAPGLSAALAKPLAGMTGFGGLKYNTILPALRMLDPRRLGSLRPESINLIGRGLPQKYGNVPDLLRLRPPSPGQPSFWEEVEQFFPSPSASAAEPSAPAEPGVMRRGTIIQKMPSIPQAGQNIAGFKAQVQARGLARPENLARKLPKPSDLGVRRFTRIEEIGESKPLEPKTGESDSPASPPAAPPTIQRAPDLPTEADKLEATASPQAENLPAAPHALGSQPSRETPLRPAPVTPATAPARAKSTHPAGTPPAAQPAPKRPAPDLPKAAPRPLARPAAQVPGRPQPASEKPAMLPLPPAGQPAPMPKSASTLPLAAQPAPDAGAPASIPTQPARQGPEAHPDQPITPGSDIAPQPPAPVAARKPPRAAIPAPRRTHEQSAPQKPGPARLPLAQPPASLGTGSVIRRQPEAPPAPVEAQATAPIPAPLKAQLAMRRSAPETVRFIQPEAFKPSLPDAARPLVNPRAALAITLRPQPKPGRAPASTRTSSPMHRLAEAAPPRPALPAAPTALLAESSAPSLGDYSPPPVDMPVVRQPQTVPMPPIQSQPSRIAPSLPAALPPAPLTLPGMPPRLQPAEADHAALPQPTEARILDRRQPGAAPGAGNVVQRLWEEHKEGMSGTRSGASRGEGKSDQGGAQVDLDKLAEEVFPLVKRLIAIESGR